MPEWLSDLSILKHQLVVREAWEIGENDSDISAVFDDDDPIIPAFVSDPPIERALAKIKKIRRQEKESSTEPIAHDH